MLVNLTLAQVVAGSMLTAPANIVSIIALIHKEQTNG
jgi:hypothetical protein